MDEILYKTHHKLKISENEKVIYETRAGDPVAKAAYRFLNLSGRGFSSRREDAEKLRKILVELERKNFTTLSGGDIYITVQRTEERGVRFSFVRFLMLLQVNIDAEYEEYETSNIKDWVNKLSKF